MPASACSTPRRSTASACRSTGSARRCATSRATASCCRPRSAACSSPRHPDTLDHGQFEGSLPFAEVYDYGYDGIMRSIEHSLHRLGTYRIDILLVHDLDVWTHGSEEARVERVQAFMAGGYRAMAEAARGGHGQGDRRRRQRDRGLPGPGRAGRLRLLPARRPLHPARAGAARYVPAAVRAAPHRAADRRRLQHGHPRHWRGRGRLFPVCAGAARDHGAGAADRGGLRPARRPPADRSTAVPARPSGGRFGGGRHAGAGRGRDERRDLRAPTCRPISGPS